MHLSGQLSDWSISDLLHIMEVTTKTGSLDIEGERRGRIHFREGKVTGAELNGPSGPYLGSDEETVADVLYVLAKLEDGKFSVGAADGPDSVGWTVDKVIKEVESLDTIEEEITKAGLLEAAGVRLATEIEAPLTVDPGDWQILMKLVKPFTFDNIEESQGRGSAVRVFHALHRLGIAETVEDANDETDWLDQLADEVQAEPEPSPNGKSPDGTADDSKDEAPQSQDEDPDAGEDTPADEAEEDTSEPVAVPANDKPRTPAKGVSAPASTTLTDGVYDEIRRLRSKVSDR